MNEWQLKRNDNNEILKLHSQFDWIDEYEWTAIAQSNPVYTLTGSQIIQQGIKKAGRPITLDGTDTRTSRVDVETLQEWANISGLTMTLTHPKGKIYKVIFVRPFITNLQAKKYRPSDQEGKDKFRFNLHFITV